MRSHLPNLVTAARGLCGVIVAALLVGPGHHFAAFWVFVAAIASDLVDGWLARRLDARSRAGEWLDPLSDKLLTDLTWVALWWIDFAPGWLAGALLARDLAVALAWAWAAPRGRRWLPNPLGQIMVAYEGVALSVLVFHGPWLGVHWPSVGVVLGTVALFLSFASLVQYAWQGPVAPGPGQASRHVGNG